MFVIMYDITAKKTEYQIREFYSKQELHDLIVTNSDIIISDILRFFITFPSNIEQYRIHTSNLIVHNMNSECSMYYFWFESYDSAQKFINEIIIPTNTFQTLTNSIPLTTNSFEVSSIC